MCVYIKWPDENHVWIVIFILQKNVKICKYHASDWRILCQITKRTNIAQLVICRRFVVNYFKILAKTAGKRQCEKVANFSSSANDALTGYRGLPKLSSISNMASK